MYLYVIFVLLALLAFWDVGRRRDNLPPWHRMVFRSAMVFLFVLSAFRWERGTDWLSYKAYFQNSRYWNFAGWLEPGFTLLNKLVAAVTADYSVMIFILAAIIFTIKPRVIYRLSPYPFVALLVWWSMNMADIFPVRQSIAATLTLWAMLFVVRRRFWPFVVLVALSTTFHATAAIFILAYFIYPLRISRQWVLVLFGGSFALAFLAEGFVSGLLGSINNPFIQRRIGNYLEAGSDTAFGMIYSTKDVLLRGFVNRSMIMAMIFIAMNRLRRDDTVFNGWANLFLLAGIMSPILSAVNVALGRIAIYFDMSQIFLLSYLFVRIRDRNNRIVIFVLLVFYLLYRFYSVVENYHDLYVPYKGLFWNVDMPVNSY